MASSGSKAAVQVLKNFRFKNLKYVPRVEAVFTRQNPFIPTRAEYGNKWLKPRYSLRQQADLVKKAKAVGLLHTLPPGPKLPPSVLEKAIAEAILKPPPYPKATVLTTPIIWKGEVIEKPPSPLGIRLYAGKSRMFKGHLWERAKSRRRKHRKMLMRDMDERIRRFKAFHKIKRPNPLSVPRPKKTKLPF